MSEELLATMKPAVEGGVPFVARTGIRLDEVAPGRVKMTMPLEPNVNHIGTMYAGALFTLSEIPGGALFMATFDATRYYPIVKGMEIRFVNFAKTDISVEVEMSAEEIERITAEADANGKANYSWECRLVDADGVVVAESTNHYQLRAFGR